MAACFCPDHKTSMVLFLERVYGIEDQAFLLHMLEVGFLPDLQASATLDTVSQGFCIHMVNCSIIATNHHHKKANLPLKALRKLFKRQSCSV